MKKIIFIFILLFFHTKTYWDFIVCNTDNINFSWTWSDTICLWEYYDLNIQNLEEIDKKPDSFDLWYFWNDFELFFSENYILNLWYFDEYKTSKITNKNPEYNWIDIWYIWNTFELKVENNFIQAYWFFDENRQTYINNQNISFLFPIWFLWMYELKDDKKATIFIPKKISYRDYFYEKFYSEWLVYFLNWRYTKSSYNKFINNLLDLLINENELQDTILNDKDIARLDLEISKWNLKPKLEKLISNLEEINNWFLNLKTREEKLYMIKYFLNE